MCAYIYTHNQSLVGFLIMPTLMCSTTSLPHKLTYISEVYHLQIPQFSLSIYQVQIVKHCNKHFSRSSNLGGKKKRQKSCYKLQKSIGGRHTPVLYLWESDRYSLLKIPPILLRIFVIWYFKGQCKLLSITPRTLWKDQYSISLILQCDRKTPTLKSSK